MGVGFIGKFAMCSDYSCVAGHSFSAMEPVSMNHDETHHLFVAQLCPRFGLAIYACDETRACVRSTNTQNTLSSIIASERNFKMMDTICNSS